MTNATSQAVRSRTERFLDVTEFAGQPVSAEQLERTCHRYHWALEFCRDQDVVELACGAGQGLGLLAAVARTLRAGDISPEVLARARATYGGTIPLDVFPATKTPLPDASVDVVLLFEAIYYISDLDAFIDEVDRVLRPGGRLLIVTANKELYDFTSSAASTAYLSARELAELLDRRGFSPTFWGYVDVHHIPLRQRLFRPLKFAASKLGLMPQTMDGKSFLKRVVFGAMAAMPARIDQVEYSYKPPVPLAPEDPCRRYKVLYCAAQKADREG